jgi:hypothetical protein
MCKTTHTDSKVGNLFEMGTCEALDGYKIPHWSRDRETTKCWRCRCLG